MSQRRKCYNNPNNFCYICGRFMFKRDERSITPRVQTLYYAYFKMKLGDKDKVFAPHKICVKCLSNLSLWSKDKLKRMPFSTTMSWHDQKDHVTDCYFCLTHTAQFTRRTANSIIYPDLPSAIRPRAYDEGEEPPVFSSDLLNVVLSDDDDVPNMKKSDEDDDDWLPNDEPKSISQRQLDLFVRRLGLSKQDACLAGSMLREIGVLAKETRTSVYKTRDAAYVPFYKRSEDNNFVFCCDSPGLLMKIGIYTQVENDWWLFIDGSTRSVKAVLLHNENAYQAIPIANSITAKESYETMKSILQLVRYDTFQWRVCSDLKVVGLLTGMQGGYGKYTCFICLWDSRAKHGHYIRNEWPARGNAILGVHNICYEPLVQSDKVIIPRLPIKLGLFKNFVNVLYSDGEPMKIIKETFPKLSLAKVKEGVFVGPDTRKLLKCQQLTDSLSPIELRAWNAMKDCVENFLGKYLRI